MGEMKTFEASVLVKNQLPLNVCLTLFTRKLFDIVKAHLPRKEFSIIVGARQVGKTTILEQIKKYLHESQESVYFLSLEDFDVLNELNMHPENIFKFVPNLHYSCHSLCADLNHLNPQSYFYIRSPP